MEKCEMFLAEKAFQADYKGHPQIEIFLCEIENGNCPYKQAGNSFSCKDGKTRYECKSEGMVTKSGLINLTES